LCSICARQYSKTQIYNPHVDDDMERRN
jgi:hypothetical protein